MLLIIILIVSVNVFFKIYHIAFYEEYLNFILTAFNFIILALLFIFIFSINFNYKPINYILKTICIIFSLLIFLLILFDSFWHSTNNITEISISKNKVYLAVDTSALLATHIDIYKKHGIFRKNLNVSINTDDAYNPIKVR